MEKREIAISFSNGAFKNCYPYVTNETVWETPGEQTLKGKEEIVPFCNKTKDYFNSIETEFIQINLIENENSVAINGTAKFIRDNKVLATVASCDVYTFDKLNNLVSIYSYCIKN